jgi:hypothetical protein
LGTQRLVGGSNSVRIIVWVVGGIVGGIRIDRVWAVVGATGRAIRRARIVIGLIRVVILQEAFLRIGGTPPCPES